MNFLKLFNKPDQIHKVYLVAKITDFDKFNEIFPDIANVSKVHPFWIYHDKKGVIKIDLGMDIVIFLNKYIKFNETFEYTLKEFIDIKYNGKNLVDIYSEFFQSFGKLFIYVEYQLHNKEYINVYTEHDTILSTQFLYKNSKESKCLYLKKFLNNDTPITPELVFLYDDKINDKI
jgi:hypothetical protein